MVRSFAIVPAAGRSVRMGCPKLLLPLGRWTIIERVLREWTASRVTRTVVVIRGDDHDLAVRVRAFDVDIVTPPTPPRDMKASIACAIEHIARRHAPDDADAWLVAPADMPHLSVHAVDRVLSAFDPYEPAAVIPTYRGRRGHPVLLPWSMACNVQKLAPREGLNSLVARIAAREIECECAGILVDLDTQADYETIARTAVDCGDIETARSAAVF